MLTISEMSAALASGFVAGVLVWLMGYGVAASFAALTAASDIAGDE
jgi:hypothetical protein